MKSWIAAAGLVSMAALGATYAGQSVPESRATPNPTQAHTPTGLHCELWSWIDVAATKGNPKLAPLRQKLLAGAADASAVQALSAPIEEGAESVSLCMGMAVDGSNKPSRF